MFDQQLVYGIKLFVLRSNKNVEMLKQAAAHPERCQLQILREMFCLKSSKFTLKVKRIYKLTALIKQWENITFF